MSIHYKVKDSQDISVSEDGKTLLIDLDIKKDGEDYICIEVPIYLIERALKNRGDCEHIFSTVVPGNGHYNYCIKCCKYI